MNTLANRILELSGQTPNKAAVIFKKEKLTYQELAKKAIGIAEILKKEGIQPGDRVCYMAISKPEMVAAYLGISLCGGVAVFLDKNSTNETMLSIYDEAGASLLLTNKRFKEEETGERYRIHSLSEVYQVADEAAEAFETVSSGYELPAEDTLSEILFTTGTTGKPKGVMLSYKAVYHILRNTMEGIGIDTDTVLLLPLPLNHSFALRVLRAVLYAGGTVVLQNGFTFAKEVENNILTHHCTGMACVPTSYEVMKTQMQEQLGAILGKLSYIEFGAGSLTIRQRQEITKLLPKVQIYNTWGSSESGGAIFCDVTAAVRDSVKIGALGRPLQGKVEVRILDPEGREIRSDREHPGRMAIQGEMVMSGYWKDPKMTAATLVDGWLLTGDLAYLDGDGDVYMLGRADDIINVGGEKVSPLDVENVACQYEELKECACIGVPDPEELLGQIPVLFVVTKPGYSEEELHKFLASKLERYKLPGRYVTLPTLPRNRMQKLDRKTLKKIWENMETTEEMNPVIENILTRRSIRKFTDADIPEGILETILKCGYYAPSGHNMQTWKFTVLTRREDIERLKAAATEAAGAKKIVVYGWENPKVLVLVSNDNRNANGCQDAACAAENMLLAAHSYGLGGVWLNPLRHLRDEEPVKSLLDEFHVPAGHTVWSAIALGYPVSDGAALKKKETVVEYIR